MTPTHIDPALSLETVTENFTYWRQTREKRGKVPEDLMEQAFSLVGHYKPTHISSALGLCYSNFRSKCIARGMSMDSGKNCSFVEVQAPQTERVINPIEVSVSRTDGAVMQINVNEVSSALELMESFLS